MVIGDRHTSAQAGGSAGVAVASLPFTAAASGLGSDAQDAVVVAGVVAAREVEADKVKGTVGAVPVSEAERMLLQHRPLVDRNRFCASRRVVPWQLLKVVGNADEGQFTGAASSFREPNRQGCV